MVFDFWKKKTEINTTQIVDEIEAAVYEQVKPYGFKKHGRTLHRFVSEDISQVIHFQSGMPSHRMSGLLCVNLGIFKKIEMHIDEIIRLAASCNLSKKDILEMVNFSLEEQV